MLKKAGDLLIVILTLTFLALSSFSTVASNNPYIPIVPTGPSTGQINVNYEFTYSTTDVGSFWKFDWGDGEFSDWIEVGESDTHISQTHKWETYGIYEVRIKHNSTFLGESSWSDPLFVTILIPLDVDGDGWTNEIEEAYETDPNDSNSYPVDTDNDGTPDYDSSDGSISGDTDDDNDGVPDSIEDQLGSNSKVSTDVTPIFIGETFYYLLNIDEDQMNEFLYIPSLGSYTTTSIEDGKLAIDIDADGSWDYTYLSGTVSVYKAPFPWLYVIIAIIIAVIVIVFILFKMGIFYLYEEEYIVEE